MERLGKKQEFRRNFGLWSALGFVSIYLATWEYVLVSLSVGFPNGGFAGLFWCFIVTVCCYATIVASLAEMESMAPTSGGQYHWVSEFAPPQYQRLLSYASGWMSTLGWLASVAASVNVIGVEIEALVEVILPDFAFTGWQLTLVMFAFILITIVFNTYGARVLPKLEIVSLIGHLLGFFVVMIPLLVLCPKNTAFDVFVNFQDNSGYNNIGMAYLTSQVTVMFCNLGSDSVVHISEEVEDASLTVPRCMWWSYVGNVVLGIIMLIVMLFCIGPLDAVIDSDVPYLLLFNNAGSPGLSVFLNVILFILIFAGNITALATCAREIWAFSRDRGLPASKWIGKMNYNLNVPDNAVYLTSFFCGILALINIGSTLAFNIIVSVSVLGLLSTYMISIGCVLWKRLTRQPLPPARWSLGRYGTVINLFGFLYSAFIIVFACFPTGLPVDTASANWAPLVWVLVIVLAVIAYVLHGKRHYTAPVEFVEGRKAAGTGLQST
ncbi:amino acid/polyamine transporter I [Rhodocollybia butyracea]|uniref:Amino acid/polyamine transporter I n=1 Tax=Rhodocollybia butyracea TaxID=206335 RepID=A0A9P5Q9T4_9AGAR|nr:amino acid/polyamine transporter I [Rhodocollybia butyracea]